MKVGSELELQNLKFKLSLIGYALGERSHMSLLASLWLVLRVKCSNFDEIKLLSKF